MRQQTKGLFFYLYFAVIVSLLYTPEVAGVSHNNICDSSGGQQIQLSKDLSLYTLIDEKNATFYAKLIYHGLAWLSLGTSPSGYMVGSEAVIGLPDVSSVSKYTLNSKATSGIVRMKDSQQTLIIGSIEQNKTHTVMEYSKKLKEPNELSIVPDAYNSLIWAVGSSSVLGHHAHRNSTTVELRTKYACENGGSLPASNNANKTNSVLAPQSHGAF
jgi:DOMON domain